MDDNERKTRMAIADKPWIMATLTVGIGAHGLPLTTHPVYLSDEDFATIPDPADFLLDALVVTISQNPDMRPRLLEAVATALDMVEKVPQI